MTLAIFAIGFGIGIIAAIVAIKMAEANFGD